MFVNDGEIQPLGYKKGDHLCEQESWNDWLTKAYF